MKVTNPLRCWIALLMASVCLVACTSHLQASPVVLETYAANTRLAEAASTTSNSLTQFRAVQRALSPPLAKTTLVDANDPGMSILASVDWSGPVEPLLEKIAAAAGYRLHVFGQAPAIPVLIAIQQKNTPLGYILRDVDYQCANKANIAVFPGMRVIELRYARS